MGAHTIGGKHDEILTLTPALLTPEVCTERAPIEVALKGQPGAYKRGKAVLKVQTTTQSIGGAKGTRDSDVLMLNCLPAVQ